MDSGQLPAHRRSLGRFPGRIARQRGQDGRDGCWTARVRHAQVIRRVLGVSAARARSLYRPAAAEGLDSENVWERTFFERPFTSRLGTSAGVARRRVELIARDQHRVSRARSGHAAAYLLSEECRAKHHVVAVVVARHAERGAGILVVAPARGGRLRVTPDSAQQRGAWPNCQCQHDRKYSCSKHVCFP
jgi:hypothetical protein